MSAHILAHCETTASPVQPSAATASESIYSPMQPPRKRWCRAQREPCMEQKPVLNRTDCVSAANSTQYFYIGDGVDDEIADDTVASPTHSRMATAPPAQSSEWTFPSTPPGETQASPTHPSAAIASYAQPSAATELISPERYGDERVPTTPPRRPREFDPGKMPTSFAEIHVGNFPDSRLNLMHSWPFCIGSQQGSALTFLRSMTLKRGPHRLCHAVSRCCASITFIKKIFQSPLILILA